MSGRVSQLGIGALDRLRQRVDIERMVEIGRHRARRRLPFLVHQRAEELIVGGGRGGAGIMRIEREEQDPAASGLDHRAHLRSGRGVAVAHAEIDHAPGRHSGPAAPRPCLRGLRLGDGHQRAFARLVVPDRLVGRAAGEGALGQDDQLQQRLPFPRRIVDHPLVRQKLVQIAAHRPVVVASGVPRLASRMPTFSAGSGGWSAGAWAGRVAAV